MFRSWFRFLLGLLGQHNQPSLSLANPAVSTKRVKIGSLVERLILAGVHNEAVSPNEEFGMTADDYTKLWPEEVEVPAGVEFDYVILVDGTVSSDYLVNATGLFTESSLKKPGDYIDLLPCPNDECGQPLKRYVAFVTTERWLGKSFSDVVNRLRGRQEGLVLDELFYFHLCNPDFVERTFGPAVKPPYDVNKITANIAALASRSRIDNFSIPSLGRNRISGERKLVLTNLQDVGNVPWACPAVRTHIIPVS